MKHGTLSTYTNHRCHCDECKEAYREWHFAKYHPDGKALRPMAVGSTISVDSDHLRRLLKASGRTIRDIEREARLSNSSLHMVLKRGRCRLLVGDAIAIALGVSLWELEATA